jgi:hypothetical protein
MWSLDVAQRDWGDLDALEALGIFPRSWKAGTGGDDFIHIMGWVGGWSRPNPYPRTGSITLINGKGLSEQLAPSSLQNHAGSSWPGLVFPRSAPGHWLCLPFPWTSSPFTCRRCRRN